MARTLSSTVGSLFDTIGSTADAATKTINTVNKLVDIADAKTETWRKAALVNAAIEQLDAATIAIQRHSLEATKRDMEIQQLEKASTDFKKFYAANKKRYEDAIANL